MFKREGSIPVDEAVVAEAVDILRNQPGGILHVGEENLAQFQQSMEPRDFAALKLDLADAQWLEVNAERLTATKDECSARHRLRPWP